MSQIETTLVPLKERVEAINDPKLNAYLSAFLDAVELALDAVESKPRGRKSKPETEIHEDQGGADASDSV